MVRIKQQSVAIYADRLSRRWIVRDPEGRFWSLPDTETPWDDRQPFEATAESQLEPVPGHYRTLFYLPFG